jgi:hypothetical protein
MTAKTLTRPLRWLNRWTAVALAAILVFGFAATAWVAWLADRELREDLLRQAQIVATAVDINHVRSLTGTETDLASPDYQSLKKQFARIKVANDKYRFIYLMGKRPDGQFFFFVDNEPLESKDYSPPGQVYDEKLEGLRRVFDTRIAVVEGPVTDRWGTWVSGLIPLIDPANGAVLAVLGMDIAAHTWAWDVTEGQRLPNLPRMKAVFSPGRRPS